MTMTAGAESDRRGDVHVVVVGEAPGEAGVVATRIDRGEVPDGWDDRAKLRLGHGSTGGDLSAVQRKLREVLELEDRLRVDVYIPLVSSRRLPEYELIAEGLPDGQVRLGLPMTES